MSHDVAKEIICLTRDCMAYMVPSGARMMLHAGTEVSITQALGNNYTVNIFGNLARIEGKDADALGKKPYNPLMDLPPEATIEDKIVAQLKTVYDPEIPVNIVDLGLVYGCEKERLAEGEYQLTLTMTLTAPGCGMGPVIAEDARMQLEKIPEVVTASVEFVFEPLWDRAMMSDVAKLELGLLD